MEEALTQSGHWLDVKSEEFERMQYYLKLCLGAPQPAQLGIWKIDNPLLRSNFHRRTAGMLVLKCWVNAATLSAPNTLASVCPNGFKMPVTRGTQGLVVAHGRVPIENLSQPQQQQQPHGILGSRFRGDSRTEVQTFVLCEVGIGRAFATASVETPIPEGYNSLYLTDISEGEDRFACLANAHAPFLNGVRLGANYKYEYLVDDGLQVLPTYVMRFYLDPTVQPKPPLAPGHDEAYDRYDFFDPVLYCPVSLRDRMVGSHSKGAPSSHRLISLDEAYQNAVNEFEQSDMMLDSVKTVIDQRRQLIEQKFHETQQNYDTVFEEIEAAMVRARSMLEILTNERMEVLLAADLELKRQQDQLQWIESHAQAERMKQSKIEFLSSWKCHSIMRADLARPPHVKEIAIIEAAWPEIWLNGELKVLCNEGDDATQTLNQDGARIAGHEQQAQPPERLRKLLDIFNECGVFDISAASASELLTTTSETIISETRRDIESAMERAATSGPPLPAVLLRNRPLAGQSYALGSSVDFFSTGVERAVDEAWRSQIADLVQNGSQDTGGVSGAAIRPNKFKAAAIAARATTQLQRVVHSSPPRSSTLNNSATPLPNSTSPIKGFTIQTIRSKSPDAMSKSQNNARMALSIRELQAAAASFSQHSLTQLKERKLRQLNIEPPESGVFLESQLLQGEIAEALWMAIPGIQSFTKLSLMLQYSIRDLGAEEPLTVMEMVDRMAEAHAGVLLVLKANNVVFGAYLCEPPIPDDVWKGHPHYFLFNCTVDLKFPYHGRTAPPDLASDGYRRASADTSRYCVKCSDNTLQFGAGDLVLQGDMQQCTSHLDRSYGFGQAAPGEITRLLCGANQFAVEEVEIWEIA